jgi:hypothetical protein
MLGNIQEIKQTFNDSKSILPYMLSGQKILALLQFAFGTIHQLMKNCFSR